jgi:iron complex outermembrane receptor protein
VASAGRVLLGDEANLNRRTGSYVVLNLNTNYRLTEKIELFGLVQNLFDARYATFGSFSPVGLVPITQVPGASNTRSLTLGAPLAGYGGVRVTF